MLEFFRKMKDSAKKILLDSKSEILHDWKAVIFGIGPCSMDYIVLQATLTILAVMKKYRDQLADIDWGWWMYQMTAEAISTYNESQECGAPIKYTTLLPMQIAHLINFLHTVRRIPCAGERGDKDLDMLAVYQTKGDDAGLYVADASALRIIARDLKSTITNAEFTEVRQALLDIVLRKERTKDRDLIPVKNGIIDYKSKTRIPFNPEYVFLSKYDVNYNPQARNVVIHNPEDGTDWDVESWMQELSDDPAIVELLWQVLGAILRPFVKWGKCAMFYAPEGNNGKGTLCQLARNLCGEGRYASIPFNAFAEDFSLEGLPNSIAIISDENDVGCYLKKAANLKAVITNDVVQINRKNKKKIPFQYFGFMLQCFNDLPRIKDKTDSFYRRLLFIPFDKCFTGAERTYIKDDYLDRPEVKEYVLWRVLNMPAYYKLSEPAVCHALLEEYKVYNDPTRQWWEEYSDKFAWDLLPWKFLYPIYKHWMAENNPSGRIASDRVFVSEMRKIAEKDDIWMCPTMIDTDGKTKDKQVSASGRIWCDEPWGACDKPGWGLQSRWQGKTHRGLVRRVPRQQAQSQPPQVQNPVSSNPYSNYDLAPSSKVNS